MTAPTAPRGIDALDVRTVDVVPPLELLRRSLPLDDPDRHALDFAADRAFARLAPGYPAEVTA